MKIEVKTIDDVNLIRARAHGGSWVWVPEPDYDAMNEGQDDDFYSPAEPTPKALSDAFLEGVRLGRELVEKSKKVVKKQKNY